MFENIIMDKWFLVLKYKTNHHSERYIRNLPLSLIEKENHSKTCLLKQNYKVFYQHNGQTAEIAQYCQSHFTMYGTQICTLIAGTAIRSKNKNKN